MIFNVLDAAVPYSEDCTLLNELNIVTFKEGIGSPSLIGDNCLSNREFAFFDWWEFYGSDLDVDVVSTVSSL